MLQNIIFGIMFDLRNALFGLDVFKFLLAIIMLIQVFTLIKE